MLLYPYVGLNQRHKALGASTRRVLPDTLRMSTTCSPLDAADRMPSSGRGAALRSDSVDVIPRAMAGAFELLIAL